MDPASTYILKFETGAATHVGKVRTGNEDSYVTRPELGLWAVADGVGGHEAGEVASQAVTDSLGSIGPSVSQADQLARFKERVLRANDKIRELIEERGGSIMGTTVAAILIHNHGYSCVWAGDSRVYRIRENRIEQISRDHSEVQELLDQGLLRPEEAKTWPHRNVITRAVGIFEDPGLDVRQGDVEAGDTFLLCSDGLTGHLSDDDICQHVNGQRSQNACDAMIETTLERGATDNVSVIVVRCHRAEKTNFMPGNPPNGARGAA